MTQKTNAARLLDQIGIPYELREYELDLENLSAESVAAKVNLPARQLFKKAHRCFPKEESRRIRPAAADTDTTQSPRRGLLIAL